MEGDDDEIPGLRELKAKHDFELSEATFSTMAQDFIDEGYRPERIFRGLLDALFTAALAYSPNVYWDVVKLLQKLNAGKFEALCLDVGFEPFDRFSNDPRERNSWFVEGLGPYKRPTSTSEFSELITDAQRLEAVDTFVWLFQKYLDEGRHRDMIFMGAISTLYKVSLDHSEQTYLAVINMLDSAAGGLPHEYDAEVDQALTQHPYLGNARDQ